MSVLQNRNPHHSDFYHLIYDHKAPNFLALLYSLCERKIDFDPQLAAALVRQAKEIPTQGSLNSRRGGEGAGSKGGNNSDKTLKRSPEDQQGGGKQTKLNSEGTTEKTEGPLGVSDTSKSSTMTKLSKVHLAQLTFFVTDY